MLQELVRNKRGLQVMILIAHAVVLLHQNPLGSC